MNIDSLSRFMSAVEDCDMEDLPVGRVLHFYCRAADDGREDAYEQIDMARKEEVTP